MTQIGNRSDILTNVVYFLPYKGLNNKNHKKERKAKSNNKNICWQCKLNNANKGTNKLN